MALSIDRVAVVVPDYDEAIAFYTQVLGFTLLQDEPLAPGKRWVEVAAAGIDGVANASLVLAKAKDEQQRAHVGNQTGGRVFLFLRTSDFWADYDRLKARGVDFIESPRHEDYGTVVVFKDLYGNLWDMVGPISDRRDG